MTEAVRPNRARRFARTLKSRPSDVIKIAESNGLRATQDAPIASPARPETKISRVIRLLQQSDGASLDELAATTGWQPHRAGRPPPDVPGCR